MKDDSLFHHGIHANLVALHSMLSAATVNAQTASEHMDRNERNLAMGTIISVKGLLDQATTLYKAVIAMHRCRL